MGFQYENNTDWRTSRGNVAPDLHLVSPDVTPQQQRYLRERVEREYAGARVVRDATATYNCHAYAHAQRHAWFNLIDQFIEDDYYPFSPGQLLIGDIVVYASAGSITHSGVITRLSATGIVEVRSKWGQWPEILHAPGTVTAAYGTITWYLRKRGTRTMEGLEPTDEELREKIEDLLFSLTGEERLSRIALASTPTAARVIVAQFPEMAELLLHGSRAARAVSDRLPAAEDDELAVLAYAVEMLGHEAALPSLATKVAALPDDNTFSIAESFLLSAFETLSRVGTPKRKATLMEAARAIRGHGGAE